MQGRSHLARGSDDRSLRGSCGLTLVGTSSSCCILCYSLCQLLIARGTEFRCMINSGGCDALHAVTASALRAEPSLWKEWHHCRV